MKLNIQRFADSNNVTPYLEFEDYPSTNTPISSENLNTVQTRIKTDINNITNGSATTEKEGNNVTLMNTLKAKLKSLKIEGKSEQDTYSGKNILSSNGLETTTIAGVTFTPVYENGLLQYVNVNGASTGTGNYTIGNISVANGNRYYISGVTGWTSSTLQLFASSSIAFSTGNRLASYNGMRSAVASGDETCAVRIYIYSKQTYDNVKIYPMVCTIEDDNYEPYTNGPSPNPDYPQEIKSVSGIGNLFDINATPIFNINNNTIATPIDNGVRVTIKSDGSGNYFVLYKLIDVSNYVGKKFTIKMDFVSSVSDKARYMIGLCDENGENRKPSTAIDISGTSYTYTIPTITTSKYLCVWLYSNKSGTATAGDYIDYTNIQVEMSDTIHTPVPYGHWLPVKVSNKNLFDKDNANILNAYINNKKIINLATARTLYIPCESDTTYTISKIKSTRFTVISTVDTPANNVVGTNEVSNNSATSLTITTGSSDKYLAVFYYNSNSDTLTEQEILNSIQIEEGSTATDYIEHQEQTTLIDLNKYDGSNNIIGNYELCSIGDVKDTLTIENGVAKITKNIGKMIFNGNETWSIGSQTYNGLHYFNTPSITDFKRGQTGITLNTFKASHFHYVPSANRSNLGGSYFINDMFLVFMNFATIVDFKTWLSTHNAELYYVLATPETITLRGTYDVKTYEDVTHISIDDDLEPNMIASGYLNSLQGKVQYVYDEVEGV